MDIAKLSDIFQRNDRTSKAKRQILYSVALKGISVLVGLVYVRLLIDILDKERYGIWLTLVSVFSLFTVFDIGLGNGLRNKLTEAIAAKKYELGRKYVSTAYILISGIFILLLLIFQGTNHFIKWNTILNTSLIPKGELHLLAAIVFGFFIFRFIFQLVGVIFLAGQEPATNNSIGTFGSVLSLLIIWVIFKYAHKISLVALGTIISAMPVFVLIAFTIFAFRGRYKSLKPSLKYVDLSLRKDLLGLGVQFFLIQISSLVLYYTANIAITQFFGPSEVTVYNIAFQYFQVPIMGYTIIVSPIWSAVTDAYTLGEFGWLRTTLKKLNYVSLIFTFGIVTMVFVSPLFYKFWIGNRVYIPLELSVSMGFYAIINIWLSPYSSYVNGLGKLRITSSFSVIAIGLYLIMLVVFCRAFADSLGVILAMSFISLIWLALQSIQTYKIIENRATGFWNM
jgi:O-antigen/teichoic acid export membrane protein